MSRPIKFRAWDKKRKAMSGVFRLELNPDSGVTGIMLCNDDDGNYRPQPDDCELMQFTGLRDKNGKEIFEGDILLCGDDGGNFDQKYVEEQDEYIDDARFAVKWCGDKDYPAFDLDTDTPDCDCNGLSYLMAQGRMEIIGNIYQNPDLLVSESGQ